MKIYIVGLNLVDDKNKPSAADSGIAPPDQLQNKGASISGKSWSYRGAGEENALHKYSLDSFIVYSPDMNIRKAMKMEDLITFAKNDKLEGVTFDNNVAKSAKDGKYNALEALNFTSIALYKLPCYLNNVLIENPKRFILGSVGHYFLAYDPVLQSDIEFLTVHELEEKAHEHLGRPWLALSSVRLEMNTLPARLKQKFIEKYSNAKARENELGEYVSAQRDKEEADKEIEMAKKLVESAEKSGDEKQVGLAKEILEALERQSEELSDKVSDAKKAYEDSEGKQYTFADGEFEELLNEDIVDANHNGYVIGDSFNLNSEPKSEVAEAKSIFSQISLRPKGQLKTVAQLLKEHESELDAIYAEIENNITEDKAFGSSLVFREVLYPAESDSFEESSIAVCSGMHNMPVRDAIVAAADVLKTIDPYLWCVYNALKIVPIGPDDPNAAHCKTLGVTQTMMFYNVDFVKSLTMSELSFIMVHEMYHVIMKHPIRGKTYDHHLWNIVLDLFVNGTIAKNYGLDLLHKSVQYKGVRKDREQTVRLTIPDSALFDPNLNVSETIPEQMYVEMMNELQQLMKEFQNQQNQNGQGGGQNQNGQGQGQNGQGQGQNGQGQGQNGQSGGGGSNGNGQNGQGNKQGNNKGNGPTNTGNRPIITDVQRDANGKITSITVQMSNGEKKTIPAGSDDVFVEPGTELSDEAQSGGGINGVLERATQAARMAGLGDSSPAFRQVTNMKDVQDKNWEKFLEKYLRECRKTTKAYRRPNRKMMNYGIIMKGRVPTDPDSLNGVYVCIDTSGSISDTDLNEMLGIIKATLKKYQITGHVLYWDTNVAAIGEFHDEKSLVAARKLAAGGGGTDPECVFRYFNSTACREKPNLVIMVTDGYFGRDIKKENPKKYGDVLWLITTGREDYLRFEPPFGKKAPLGFHWGRK